MDAAAEIRRNPVSKHQIQPDYGNEQQADAGRNCRTRLARPNSQARTGTGDPVAFREISSTQQQTAALMKLLLLAVEIMMLRRSRCIQIFL